MITFRWIACLLVFFAAIGTRIERHNSVDAIATSIHKRGLEFKTSNNSLVDFVGSTFIELAQLSDDKRLVKVNQPYDQFAINVLLLDFSKVDAGQIPTTATGLYSIQPNVIVVDTGFVEPLLLNAFNDSVGFAQMLFEVDDQAEKSKSKKFDGSLSAETWGALAFHLQLRNISFKRESQIYGKLIAQVIGSDSSFKSIHLAFSYPFAHELYHVRSDTPFSLRLNFYAEREERNADLFAMRVIKRRLKRSDKTTNGELFDNELVHLGLKYFEDIILSELLKDFRGLSAEDYLVVLFHRPCEQSQKIPWPRRFHNPEVVFEGAFRSFPVMTNEEFGDIRKKVKRFETESHENLLGRILRMREVFDDNEHWASITKSSFSFSEALYSAYFQGQGAAALVPEITAFSDNGNKSLRELLERLKPLGVWEQGAGCDLGACGVIRFDKGYLEIFAKNDLIQNLRLVEVLTEKNNSIAQIILSYFFNVKVASKFNSHITKQINECHLSTFTHEESPYKLLAHVLNESGLIETEIVAN